MVSAITYLPFLHGRYDIAPGLSRLGRDFGNGRADRLHFQFDDRRTHYLAAKKTSFERAPREHYATHCFDEPVRQVVCHWIAKQLAEEHPECFAMINDGTLQPSDAAPISLSNPSVDAFHALAMQVQEDLAVICVDDDRDWMSAIHLCLPNHWSAAQKIGGSFFEVHQPVAGIEPINRRASEFARVMMNATNGLVRFAWGIATDDRLAHPPNDPLPARVFDRSRPAAWVRVERQTIRGFPHVRTALFTIRTYLVAVASLSRAQKSALASAVRSMTPPSLQYKGLACWRDDLLEWLDSTASDQADFER